MIISYVYINTDFFAIPLAIPLAPCIPPQVGGTTTSIPKIIPPSHLQPPKKRLVGWLVGCSENLEFCRKTNGIALAGHDQPTT